MKVTVFSDILCVWALIGQVRLDEVRERFGDQVELEHRFCAVFADTAHKIGVGWAGKGGYDGFNAHVLDSAGKFDHVHVNPGVWQTVRPASSMPAHLTLKCVQAVAPEAFDSAMRALRSAFFDHCEDIASWAVIRDALAAAGVSVDAVQAHLLSGAAHAALEADERDRHALGVRGSPTLVLDGGREMLFGNVGYRVIEANIQALLTDAPEGSARWC
ncbi:MAG: DsbA family protein [Planctomycetota bacterium]